MRKSTEPKYIVRMMNAAKVNAIVIDGYTFARHNGQLWQLKEERGRWDAYAILRTWEFPVINPVQIPVSQWTGPTVN